MKILKLYQIILLFFLMIPCCLQAEAAKAVYGESAFNTMYQAALKLNDLINKADGLPLSLSDQRAYVAAFQQFQNAMNQYHQEGNDIGLFQKNYIPSYQLRAASLLTDKQLIQQMHGQQEVVIPENSVELEFTKARGEQMRLIYKYVQDQVLSEASGFRKQVQNRLDNLGSYSPDNAKLFTKFLSDSVRGFIGVMHTIQVASKNHYYDFLSKHDRQAADPRYITPDEHELFSGVDAVVGSAILQVRGFVLAITSSSIRAQLGQEIEAAIQESEEQAKKEYDAQLAENEKGLNQSWWQDVREYGKELLSEFATQFKRAVSKEVAKQTTEAVSKYGGEVAGAVGKRIGSVVKPISSGLAEKVSELSEKLAKEGISKVWGQHSDATLNVLKKTIKLTDPVRRPEQSVSVQENLSLCADEKIYLQNRMPKIQKILKTEFDINQPLKIGFCCSGGGNRAMIGTLGMLTAAARHKILQVSLYVVGLSGSTWCIAPWSYLYAQNKFKSKDFEASLNEFKEGLQQSLNDTSMIDAGTGIFSPPMLTDPAIANNFTHDIAIRFAYNLTLSAVDFYGALIGNYALRLVGPSRLEATWSSIASNLKGGILPLPLCSSAFEVQTSPRGTRKEWLETGPFQAGSSVLGYIPIQYLGSTFNNGVLDVATLCPEYPLSFYLGLYGSAFSITFNDAIEKGLTNPSFDVAGEPVTVPVDTWIRTVLDEAFGTVVRGKRPKAIHVRFANFSQGLKASALQNDAMFGSFDGGIAFNFPLPLLLDRPERALDVIFIYDSNNADVDSLKDATAYFKYKNIAVPDMSKVSKRKLLETAMTVFNDPRDSSSYDVKKPTFIYFPTRNIDISKPPYITPNFKYTAEQIQYLALNMEESFESQVPDLKIILKLVAQQKYGNV